jgi:hypothetical protein
VKAENVIYTINQCNRYKSMRRWNSYELLAITRIKASWEIHGQKVFKVKLNTKQTIVNSISAPWTPPQNNESYLTTKVETRIKQCHRND